MSEIPFDAQSFQILVENIEDYAIFFLNPGGRISTWNKGAQRLKGYSSQEVLGQKLDLFYTEEDAKAGKADIELEEARSKGRVEDEGWRVRKDGSHFWANVVITAIYNAQGHLIGFAKITRDITERKLNENRLQAANESLERAKKVAEEAKELAEKANRAKSEFLANMSHEIRTPLNGIIGVAELLQATQLDHHQRDLLDTIRFSGDNLLTVLNDILDFSKIEHDKLELDFHAFNLLNLVDDVNGLFYYRSLEKQVELSYQIEPNLPLDYIGDGLRIRQILVNLVSNAIKFTERGAVLITIGRASESKEYPKRMHVRFSVRDTGIGIPEDRLSQLFTPFSQLDASTARKFGGSGLGLAICERLIALMGGSIHVESKVDEGSIFSFDIILRQAEGNSSLAAEKDIFSGKRVLVVDDIEANRNMLRLILRRWGIETAEAADSDQTVGLLKQDSKFDAALIDYHMPASNGLSLARRINQLNLPKSLPLVLISSYTGKYSEDELRSVGYVAAIAKPLRQSILRSTLQEILLPELKSVGHMLKAEGPQLSERKVSLLVVEDNAVNRKVILQMLKRLGVLAESVPDGLLAIEVQKMRHFDLILMDVHMPTLDGVAATREIRALFPAGGRPKIVALTADSTETERRLCLEAGMDDFVTKPIKLDDLRKIVEKYGIVS